ncbi:hypothetical protein CLIB1423_17S00980 [[Candida] railenensis]|uniref:Uncharacterized protein n=1 Tax=[Candida] railenensis TaxID=45579 RepID=A0A9P0QT58_9ASCO|nr:hypothetical protein CLIB1423_17S00980 [[Candida] railenensis]
MAVNYPRRELTSEPFGDQMDLIEKRWIESQNMPILYMNTRKKPKSQLQQQQSYQAEYQQQRFQYNPQQQNYRQQQQQHMISLEEQQLSFSQHQQHQQPHQLQHQLEPTYSQQYYPATSGNMPVSTGSIGTDISAKQVSTKPTFDPFATEFQPNYTQNIWGSGNGNREKGITTVWG